MSFRRTINRTLRPLLGYEISKVEFDQALWDDVKTVLAGTQIRTVFDVGANEGQSAREFLRHFPGARIFSFEPTPAIFARLRSFAETHPLVTPINRALGETPGKSVLNENAFHQANSLLAANPGRGLRGAAHIEAPEHHRGRVDHARNLLPGDVRLQD